MFRSVIIGLFFCVIQLIFIQLMKGKGDGIYFIQVDNLRSMTNCIFMGIILKNIEVKEQQQSLKKILLFSCFLFIPFLFTYSFFPIGKLWHFMENVANGLRYFYLGITIVVSIYLYFNWRRLK